MSTPFPYAARARDVEEAHSAINASFRNVRNRSNPADPATAKWIASIERFNAALAVAYPENFWSDLDDLRAGNSRHIETALPFLEADPLSSDRAIRRPKCYGRSNACRSRRDMTSASAESFCI